MLVIRVISVCDDNQVNSCRSFSTGARHFSIKVQNMRITGNSAGTVVTAVFFLTCFGLEGGELVIRFHGVEDSRGGRIMVGLYDSRVNRFKPGYEIAGVTIDVTEGETPEAAVFRDLPAGDYAVSALHDEDGDGVMDTGFLGIALEGYGFSQVKKVPLGRPPFEDTSVHVEESRRSSAVVYMRYL